MPRRRSLLSANPETAAVQGRPRSRRKALQTNSKICLHNHPNQGVKVRTTERNAKSASRPKNGRFAPLGSLLHVRGSGAPRIGTLFTTASLCVLAGLLFGGASARAEVIHEYLSQIPAEVPAEGPHHEPVLEPGPLNFGPRSGGNGSMVVHAGHLWLAEPYGGGGRVDEYDASSGAFEEQLEPGPGFLGVAVGEGTGEREVYVSGGVSGGGFGVAVFGPSGKLQATWTGADTPGGPCASAGGVAVDDDPTSLLGDWAAGDVYVACNQAVDVFKPGPGGTEAYVTQIAGTPSEPFSGTPGGVAVDESSGEVLVVAGNAVDVFKPTILGKFEFVRQLAAPNSLGGGLISGVAVDGANGNIYVGGAGEVQSGAEEVDEYSSEGAASLGHFSLAASGQHYCVEFGSVVAGVAVEPLSGDVYVKHFCEYAPEPNPRLDLWGPNIVIPNVVTLPVSGVNVGSRGAISATFNGEVNPLEAEAGAAAECKFVWGTSEAFGQEAACEPPEVKGSSPVPVHTELKEELQPDTTYYYRLQATSLKNGKTNAGEASQDQQFTTPGPGLASESVSDVTSTSMTLNGTVTPHGDPTSVYFEYGSGGLAGCAANPCVPAAPGEAIGAGDEPVELAPRHVQGLSAGTVYHYRVVAVSELNGKLETFYGPDQTFTTQTGGAFTLPDGRAWEMVSPPQKDGALVQASRAEGGFAQAATGGGAISYLTNVPTESGALGFANISQVLSRRAPDGWVTGDLGIAHDRATGQIVSEGQEYRFFSEDLSQAVVQPLGQFVPCTSAEGEPQPCLSPHASEQTAFLHTLLNNANPLEPCTSSCYRPLVTGCPQASQPCPPAIQENADVPDGAVFGQKGETGSAAEGRPCPPERHCGPSFEGAAPDANHIVFQSRASLSAAYPYTAGEELYEWNAGKPADEQLAPISVEPAREGKPEEPTPTQGYLGSKFNPDARGAISDDGSRVFWTDQRGTLYMRDTVKQQTIQIGANGAAEAGPQFQFASAGGSRIFYREGVSHDLFVCEISEGAGGELECKTADLNPGGPVQGTMIGGSEDGSYVYFVAGNLNLYMDHYDGAKWDQTLIATLSSEDRGDWQNLSQLTARVSPDGRWLAFMSDRDLTGYDTEDASSGKPDEEAYLYDSATGHLACASCDPTGARPTGVEYGNGFAGENALVRGERVWESHTWLAADLPAWSEYESGVALYQPHYLSNEGRLFFDAYGALVPRDVNGTWDAYEYEPAGVGSCASSSSSGSSTYKPSRAFETGGNKGEEGAGCVGLLSSGTSAQESAFVDASETGGDVFFLTTSKLSTADFDKSYDMYDAHECTSASPCVAQPPLAPPECATADECRAAPTPEPSIYGAPSSATFNGLGNLTPPPPPAKPAVKKKTVKCKKHFVKNKKGQCVRKKSKSKKKTKGKKTNRRASR
jgi:hypothetical protein